jgi:colanic acid/amylovoran biosynthesis glycosyltransferase
MKARIVIVVPSFPRLSETFIVSKFLGLLERGWDVHIFCGSSLRREWVRIPLLVSRDRRWRKRVHVAWRHRPRALAAALIPFALLRCLILVPGRTVRYLVRGWGPFGRDVFRRLYLDAELIRLGPDVVHFEFGALAVDRMYLRRLLECRIIVSFRGYDLNYAGLEKSTYYEDVWTLADGLHFLGNDLRRRAQRRGCPPDKLHAIIPPAVRTEFFDVGRSERPESPGGLRILGVGRLVWTKGFEYALLAVRRLVDAGVACEYRIVGEGALLGALHFARRQLGLEEVVTLAGPGTRDDVKRAMASADVFLHAAVSEGFSNVVIEAQAMQLPVVCTDADGLAENVANGETGFIVPRRCPEALAERLQLLAADPALRRRMGEAGRRRVQAHFRLEDQLTAFENLYRRVLALECGREAVVRAVAGTSASG